MHCECGYGATGWTREENMLWRMWLWSKAMALVRERMHKYVDIAQRNDGKERNWH